MDKLIVGNIKMNIVSEIERDNYFKSFRDNIRGKKIKKTSIAICPPAILLESFMRGIKNKNVSFGVQDAYWENAGSFTGEISSAMVKNMGANYQIVGHSERRLKFGETNEDVNRKIGAAFRNSLIPIMCVGESSAEKEAEETKEVIVSQMDEGLNGLSKTKISNLVIAYEPIWAIGSGRLPAEEEIMGVRILIQKILADKFDLTIKQMPMILYGGSVNYKNVQSVCLNAGMDGVLVGGESLHPASFLKIVDVLEEDN